METQDTEEHRQGMQRVGEHAGTADLMSINNSPWPVKRNADLELVKPGFMDRKVDKEKVSNV